jgi:hypothetical protein
MSRVILYRVGGGPRVIWLAPDPGGSHATALGRLLGIPVARLPLYDGIELCCDHDGLLLGLALARRALAASPIAAWAPEVARSVNVRILGLSLDEWPVSGDFLLARTAASGELVDLSLSDVRFWMFWLGLDYVLHH